MKKIILSISLLLFSIASQAYTEACQLVAEKAGKEYQSKPNRFASISAPEDLPASFEVNLIERNGMWFIYQAEQEWFAKEECAPKTIRAVETVPVLLNQMTGRNAVVNGAFLIKTWQVKHIDEIAGRYKFVKVTQLPNRFTAVFDTKPQASYDQLIETLKVEKDIEKFVPLLSEPRYRPR